MDEIMAEQKQQEELQQENEVLDKKQLKAAKKLEKKKRKQKNPDDLDGDEETVGGKILVFFVTIISIWIMRFAANGILCGLLTLWMEQRNLLNAMENLR